MSPPNSFDDKTVVTKQKTISPNDKPKSKRGRKALAVSEGHIDVTGKTHIMTVRRSNPPVPKKKLTAPKVVKQTNHYCRRCDQNDEYIDVLNDRIGKLESLVNKLTNVARSNDNILQQNLANIGTEDLLGLSNQISLELFERFGIPNQLQTPIQLQTPFGQVQTPIHPMQPAMPIQVPMTITPPVSPSTCEQVDLVQDWSVFPSFDQQQY